MDSNLLITSLSIPLPLPTLECYMRKLNAIINANAMLYFFLPSIFQYLDYVAFDLYHFL